MAKFTTKAKDSLHLKYQKRGLKLWGTILFFRRHQASGETIKPYRQSRPFVIGDYSQGVDKPVIYGSLVFLLTEIKRLINQFTALNRAHYKNRDEPTPPAPPSHLELEYERQVMDFTILLATYGRNLLDILGRLGDETMPKLNYDNEPDGEIRLRELFDTLIHNRYYYFDGAHMRDIFSDAPPLRRTLANRFMGYGFDLDAFGHTMWNIVHDIRLKDLTQLIRQRFKRLSTNSRPQDIVFLIQNVESLSHLLKSKTWSEEYRFMRDALFASAGLTQRGSTFKFQPLPCESPPTCPGSASTSTSGSRRQRATQSRTSPPFADNTSKSAM